MEKQKLVYCLRQLSLNNLKDTSYESFLETQTNEVCGKLEISHQDIQHNISGIIALNFSTNFNLEWNYISLGLYIINALGKESEKFDEVYFSVQEIKDVKTFIRSLVTVGIRTKLQPNLPFYIKSAYFSTEDIFWNYNVLKCTTFGLTEFLKLPTLRLIILPDYLKEILVALYQISYCPLKNPSNTTEQNSTQLMTKEIYAKLLQEQQLFLKILEHLKQSIHSYIFVKETMVIFHENSPKWFKKQISHNLTSVLRSTNGVQAVVASLLGDQESSNTQNWKTLDILAKLILDCKKFPDFKENICRQLIVLLHRQKGSNSIVESIFANCTKILYVHDAELCKSVFVREIVTPFLYFTYKSHKFSENDITENIKLATRLLNGVFIGSDGNSLPLNILKPIINVIFRFYILTMGSSLRTINNDLKDVILLYLEDQQANYISIFDAILFNIESPDILQFRNDIIVQLEGDNIKIVPSKYRENFSASENCDCIYRLFNSKPELLALFFGFLLNCISNESKYFEKSNEVLLELTEDMAETYFERKIVVYKLLSQIAQEKIVQKQLNENPVNVIEYIETVLKRALQLSNHPNEECDDEDYQSVFTVLLILENLVINSSEQNYGYYKILSEPLRDMHATTSNKETKDLIKNILDLLDGAKVTKHEVITEDKTLLERTVDDICDPMLPIRGHGLISLTKLIENKDKETLDKKQFVLNILQQNISDKDSFIYLSAINGLAAMADIFPDTVLRLLCDEYSDSSRKDNEDYSEVRMKLGEVLVKVSRILGDMAPKYKPLLLNTFLIGTKDDDDLIRSSSLSNLGEICSVLGYKLGSIFTEVLVTVHGIIATDKSPQARRAAVSVIKQLFVGLDQEIISFFKEDILPVYRTLKQIYNNDKDDVMRLQAQLALEELNDRMKNFVFPNPQLNYDKKIVVLN